MSGACPLAAPALAFALLLAGCAGGPQCVPYARRLTGVTLTGDAAGWWAQAAGRYVRAGWPAPGAILVFQPTLHMPAGHVAVVRRLVDARTILVDHANWEPGQIDHAAPVRDISPGNDWSLVRVWWRATGRLGTQAHPTYGFILPGRPAGDGAPVASWQALPARAISACMAGPTEPCPADNERTGSPSGGKRV